MRSGEMFNMEAKKQAVLGNKNKASSLGKLIALALAVLALVAGGAYMLMDSGADEAGGLQAGATSGGSKVLSFQTADLADGKAKYYAYKVNDDMTIRFFMLKSSDGVIRAAFDACDVCWPAGKGYAQEGDVMICRNCGQRFASTRINEVRGGCNPSPLERRLEGDKGRHHCGRRHDRGQIFQL